jgi:hypothetical protein
VACHGSSGMDQHDLRRACLEAEELADTESPEEAAATLAALVAANPTRPEPMISLAKLHRWLGLRDMHRLVDRAQLVEARRLLLAAIELEPAPDLQTLTLLQDVTHGLALHAEQAAYFTDLAQRDPRARVRFESLSWASVALECRGQELVAEGRPADAAACFEESVASHRQARNAWPEAPVAARLLGLLGGSHTVGAYAEAGRHEEWIALAETELDSAEGQTLPASSRVECLFWASEVAVRGKLYAKVVRLTERARVEWEGAAPGAMERQTQLRVEIAGQLLLAHRGRGNQEAKEDAARAVLSCLSELEEAGGEPEVLRECYNLASRHFVVAEEWERAVQTARRATELWDFGPNYWFLAVALWAGPRDRAGTLEALRNAARDARLSGKGQCRNLRDDFLKSTVFADVRDDPEFLGAIEVPGVVG